VGWGGGGGVDDVTVESRRIGEGRWGGVVRGCLTKVKEPKSSALSLSFYAYETRTSLAR